ncbi:ABC transporter ATP-binding protein [Streptomyces sp. NPDC040724]|uniref:ABC transporter ATP-binding protein n=1 Tax=Streptomyces sp. NPDC040724 TaxID=3155612 RepID=UPI00340318B9
MLLALIRPHLARHTRAIVLIVGLQLAAALWVLYLPTLNADIIDSGVMAGDMGRILGLGGWMACAAGLHLGCTIAAVYFSTRVTTAVGHDMRASAFHHVQSIPARELRQFGSATLLTRTTNDVQQVQFLCLAMITTLVPVPILGLGGLFMALTVDAPLSTLILLSLPLVLCYAAFFLRRMLPRSRNFQERLDDVNRTLGEHIAGSRVIRAFNREAHEVRRFDRTNKDLLDTALAIGRLTALMTPVALLVANLSSVAVLWAGGHRVDSGGMTVGSLTAFVFYLAYVLTSVTRATMVMAMLPRGAACAARIREVLDVTPETAPVAAVVTEPPRNGRIELRDVEFRYPRAERPVLNGVSLVVPPGRTTAIVGATGSGKSTVLELMARRLPATAGAVRIDGVDLGALDPVLLPRTVGFLPQHPYLFRGTVASNLRMGRPDASDEELWEALETAQAMEFVQRTAEGLDAPVAQGGSNFSGGQQQRLAVARVLISSPRVYLLDDPFSALDHLTAGSLMSAVTRRTAGATVVMVAQRVDIVREADQILVLDRGRISAAGTHRDLLAESAVYREMIASQRSD